MHKFRLIKDYCPVFVVRSAEKKKGLSLRNTSYAFCLFDGEDVRIAGSDKMGDLFDLVIGAQGLEEPIFFFLGTDYD